MPGMFKIGQAETYQWPVTVTFPDDKKAKKETFTAVFKRLPQDELSALLDEGVKGTIEVKPFCRRIMAGWLDVSEDGANPLPFSEENLEKMLDMQLVAAAIQQAFLNSLAVAREKN